MIQTSDRGSRSLFRNPIFLSCLVVCAFALLTAVVMLISWSSDSRKLKSIRNEYESVRAEYKAIVEKNDPSDKKQLSNNQIKRNLAGQSEDEEQEIRQNKTTLDKEIEKRQSQIDTLLTVPESPAP